jgi:hypothetical protein
MSAESREQPEPLRPASDAVDAGARAELVWRRARIADEIEQQERDRVAWNALHPNDPPIESDDELLAWARRARELEAADQ